MFSEWNFTFFMIQVLGGFVGAHLIAVVAHEHRFGFFGHSLAGVAAGALGGLFLQRIVMTTVTATGDAMPIANYEALIYQAAAGLIAGAIAMLAAGIFRHEITKNPGKTSR
jgi:hypothetical protein